MAPQYISAYRLKALFAKYAGRKPAWADTYVRSSSLKCAGGDFRARK
jgi:hypothetical protein